ncbi:minor capsid protein, partial [Streptomyces sp. NPDC058471]|uniref:minor capsid protein n=1 Tax=Streptomyces sp. NPDC058471 TaxID=3346516 RepID=UPI0036681921
DDQRERVHIRCGLRDGLGSQAHAVVEEQPGLSPSPDRCICLSAYPVTDSPVLTDTTTDVQVCTRASSDPREVDALDDAVREALHGSGPHRFGAAQVQLVFRVSAAPIGADSAGRWERTSNFYVRAHRAAPHLE